MPSVTDVVSLLREFERCHATGVAMDPLRGEALAGIVRDRLHEVYFARAEEIPVFDGRKREVLWRKEAEIRYRRDLIDAYGALDVAELGRTLDRMLRRGLRGAEARLATQFRAASDRGLSSEAALRLIDDCWKYAIADELRNIDRRRRGVRRRPEKPRPDDADAGSRKRSDRKADQRSLVRACSVAELRRPIERCPEDLAFVIAYEYQAGGLPREAVGAFERLAFGNSTLGPVFDAIDRAFVHLDREAERADRFSTRRRSARLTGLAAPDFAALLREFGLEYAPSGLPRLAKRRRDRCRKLLDSDGMEEAP